MGSRLNQAYYLTVTGRPTRMGRALTDPDVVWDKPVSVRHIVVIGAGGAGTVHLYDGVDATGKLRYAAAPSTGCFNVDSQFAPDSLEFRTGIWAVVTGTIEAFIYGD